MTQGMTGDFKALPQLGDGGKSSGLVHCLPVRVARCHLEALLAFDLVLCSLFTESSVGTSFESMFVGQQQLCCIRLWHADRVRY